MPDPVAPVASGPHTAVVDDPIETDRCTRWVVAADGSRRAETFLQLSGMYCAACADTIEQALQQVDGVAQARVSAATERATVQWDPARTRLSGLIEAVRGAGYDAVPDLAAPARELRRREHRSALWRFFVASFCAMQVMMLATPSYVAAPGDLADDMRRLLNWGQWVLSLPVMGFSAGPFLRGAWASLRSRRIGMDVPVSLGIVVTFVASMGATFDPSGPFGHEVYFDSLTMFLSFLLGARWLELRARHRAAEDLERALGRMPESAERQRTDGGWETVSVQRLVAGDRVRVALGQAFPADGVITEGRTAVDEALLTGESTALARAAGQEVVGGSLNVGAPVVMQVQRAGQDTRLEAIVAMMREAMSQRPAAARLADRWAAPFLWAVIVLAAGSAAVWSVIDPPRALWVGVAVLIVTCPCALSLAAPSALVAAAGGLARRGVLFRRLEAIETLAAATRLFVDKTGTLTEDRPALVEVAPLPGASIDAAGATAVAASLAEWSTHPLSRALAAAAGRDGAAAGLDWSDPSEQPGQGLQARDPNGRTWRLGSWHWTGGAGEAPLPAQVWLGREGHPLAAFRFDEVLREGAAEAVSSLRARGLAITLLSGDSAERAAAMAARLGLADVVGSATPEGKLEQVAAAQSAGETVAMLGDGINDAPVLARADVSLAMGQGALVARAHADAVIVSSRPADLVRARDTARRSVRIVRQNLLWAAVYNAACIPLAMAGLLPPWAAGLGMASSSLLVILNSLRAAR